MRFGEAFILKPNPQQGVCKSQFVLNFEDISRFASFGVRFLGTFELPSSVTICAVTPLTHSRNRLRIRKPVHS